MKTTILSLIAVFLFGMIATGFLQKPETNNQILLHATNRKITSIELSQSADIIRSRLNNFSTEKSEVTIIQGKNQIKIVLADKWDLKFAEKLVTQKGSLAFYETFFTENLTNFWLVILLYFRFYMRNLPAIHQQGWFVQLKLELNW